MGCGGVGVHDHQHPEQYSQVCSACVCGAGGMQVPLGLGAERECDRRGAEEEDVLSHVQLK